MTSVSKHSRGGRTGIPRSIDGVRGERSVSMVAKSSSQTALLGTSSTSLRLQKKLASTAKKASLLFEPKVERLLDDISLSEQVENAIKQHKSTSASSHPLLKGLVSVLGYTPKSFSLSR